MSTQLITNNNRI